MNLPSPQALWIKLQEYSETKKATKLPTVNYQFTDTVIDISESLCSNSQSLSQSLASSSVVQSDARPSV